MCTLGQKTQELVALAKEGDESALNRLYTVYAERVRWMVRFRMGKDLRAKLESMGHKLGDSDGGFGGYQAILRDEVEGVYYGASEVRKDGQAAGY